MVSFDTIKKCLQEKLQIKGEVKFWNADKSLHYNLNIKYFIFDVRMTTLLGVQAPKVLKAYCFCLRFSFISFFS